MSKIKAFFRQSLILLKRLFKKPGFIVILLLVPLITVAMSLSAKSGDSGVITIALAKEDGSDEIANKIVGELLNEKSLIRFVNCETKREASAMVESGKADAAWIFAADLAEKIDKFSKHTHKNNSFVVVIQREESISLRLSQEKLNYSLFPYISRALYRDAVCDVINTKDFSKEELDRYYDAINADGDELFDFVYSNNSLKTGDNANASFILSPLKGLLAILVLLAGIAVSMFYLQDKKRGVFDRLTRNAGFSLSSVYHAVGVFPVGIAAFLSLAIVKIGAKWWIELPIILIYCCAVTFFSMTLEMLIRDLRIFGAISPILTVITAVLCPIFIVAPKLSVIQLLLPTYYYVMSFTNKIYILYMIVYTAALCLLAFFLHASRVNRKR